MADKTDAQLLAEAEAELHKIRLGKQSNEVQVDGRRVRYGRADIGKLEAYIEQLRARVAGGSARPGAIGFIL